MNLERSMDPLPVNDLILPEQFARNNQRRCRTGEQRLMLAVLSDAAYIYCTQQGRRRGLRVVREIEEWFRSTDTSYVFAFESICDSLGLDPTYVRGRLAGSRRRQVVRQPAAAVETYAALKRAVGD